MEDRWSLPHDGYGDCEDYQLLKRRLLVAAGLPARALRMTVVLDEQGTGHAVLTVRTRQSDLILDNKTDRILPWHRTGYTYLKLESDIDPGWVSLGWTESPHKPLNGRCDYSDEGRIQALSARRLLKRWT